MNTPDGPCPACDDSSGRIERYCDGPNSKTERCEICLGTGSCSEVDALRYEVQKLRVERLASAAETARLRAQAGIYKPLVDAAIHWRHGVPGPALAGALIASVDKAQSELEKLAVLLGVRRAA